jgi:hypothetical protein
LVGIVRGDAALGIAAKSTLSAAAAEEAASEVVAALSKHYIPIVIVTATTLIVAKWYCSESGSQNQGEQSRKIK